MISPAQDAASSEISHWAIVASAADIDSRAPRVIKNGDDNIDDLDDLEGDHAAKGDKIPPIESPGMRGWLGGTLTLTCSMFTVLAKGGGIGASTYLYRPNTFITDQNDPQHENFRFSVFLILVLRTQAQQTPFERSAGAQTATMPMYRLLPAIGQASPALSIRRWG